MEKAISREEEKIFSESKKGVNYSIIFIFGILYLSAIILLFVVALVAALLLLMAEIFFGPLAITIFGVNMAPLFSWLASHQWLIGGLSVIALIFFWCIYKAWTVYTYGTFTCWADD